MINYRSNQNNNTGGNNGPSTPDQYQKHLQDILAKAGGQKLTTAGQNQSQAQANNQPAQAPQAAPQPATPQASTPSVQDPSQRLQSILAMAGMTPAQQAQANAQAKLANSSQAIMQVVQNYKATLAANPAAILKMDVEFASNVGANDDLYLKCYCDNNNNCFWDIFGNDVSYVIPSSMTQYELIDSTYYKAIPEATLWNELATATVHSHSIV